MHNDYFRYYKPQLLLLFLITLTTLIGAILTPLTHLINEYFKINYSQYPSTGALLGIILLVIDQYLWKYKLFKWLFWVKNISGRYKGHIEYRHYQSGIIEKKECYLEIQQCASRVKVNCFFNDSELQKNTNSKSLTINIVLDDFGNQTIVFTYHNLGNLIHNHPPHYGTNILEIKNIDENIELEGTYYTDKEPQTKGHIKVSFISKNLKHKF